LAENIVVLGYPKFDLLGQDLKVTQGIISGLPNASFDNMLLYDATANPGNSGGPICNLHAQVVAVCTAGLEEQRLGLGISSVTVLEFLRGHANLPPAASTTADLSQANVAEQVGASTVNVLVFQTAETPGFSKQFKGRQGGASAGALANGFEDVWCMGCNGSQKVECPIKGCSGGNIRTVVKEAIGQNAQSGMILGKTKSVVTKCKTCGGYGKVKCPVCRDGTDEAIAHDSSPTGREPTPRSSRGR
jgi:S1-C subfamily serine protease